MNQLEKWSEDGVILINMSGTARTESLASGNVQRTSKMNQRNFTATATADEAVAFVRDKPRERDDFNRQVVREFGGQSPDWTGQDQDSSRTWRTFFSSVTGLTTSRKGSLGPMLCARRPGT